jgi:hypothetical protein
VTGDLDRTDSLARTPMVSFAVCMGRSCAGLSAVRSMPELHRWHTEKCCRYLQPDLRSCGEHEIKLREIRGFGDRSCIAMVELHKRKHHFDSLVVLPDPEDM